MTVSMEMFVIIWAVAVIAYIIDGRIKKKMYVTDINLANIRIKKELDIKFQQSTNLDWQEMVNVNSYRYGIIGKFDYDIKPTDQFETSGEPTFIGTGIILDRQFVTRDDIINNMAAFYQKSKKNFVADPKELRDRHIVVIYIQDHDLKQFIWDDEGLYNNVDKGDRVSISYNEKGPLSIGYKLKGERNDSNTKRRLDMENSKKIS